MSNKNKVETKYTDRYSIQQLLETRNYAEWSEARKFLKYVKRNMLFALMNTVKIIFPVSQKISLCYNKIPCVFPVWKK